MTERLREDLEPYLYHFQTNPIASFLRQGINPSDYGIIISNQRHCPESLQALHQLGFPAANSLSNSVSTRIPTLLDYFRDLLAMNGYNNYENYNYGDPTDPNNAFSNYSSNAGSGMQDSTTTGGAMQQHLQTSVPGQDPASALYYHNYHDPIGEKVSVRNADAAAGGASSVGIGARDYRAAAPSNYTLQRPSSDLAGYEPDLLSGHALQRHQQQSHEWQQFPEYHGNNIGGSNATKITPEFEYDYETNYSNGGGMSLGNLSAARKALCKSPEAFSDFDIATFHRNMATCKNKSSTADISNDINSNDDNNITKALATAAYTSYRNQTAKAGDIVTSITSQNGKKIADSKANTYESSPYQTSNPLISLLQISSSSPNPPLSSKPVQPEAQKHEDEYSIFNDAGFTLSIPSLVTTPMTAKGVMERVNQKTDEVVTMYLPCVEFLVACQQELRAGLAHAMKRKSVRGGYKSNMTPAQFFRQHIEPLSSKFYRQNRPIMPEIELRTAVSGICALIQDAKKAQPAGCEAVKNAFLGGMRDGESWGLRKWLSKNGGALKICNDLELILGALQKLDRSNDTTIRLAERIRPKAKQAFDRLKNDVPSAYQETSTAHPYLPFFHRLEAALRGLSNFDPEDDDVICLDDSDDEDENGDGVDVVEPVKSGVNSSASSKLNVSTQNILSEKHSRGRKRKHFEESRLSPLPLKGLFNYKSDLDGDGTKDTEEDFDALLNPLNDNGKETSDLSDDDSDIEVIYVKNESGVQHRPANIGTAGNSKEIGAAMDSNTNDELLSSTAEKTNSWRCNTCMKLNAGTAFRCVMCDSDNDNESDDEAEEGAAAAAATFELSPYPKSTKVSETSDSSTIAIHKVINSIGQVAQSFELRTIHYPSDVYNDSDFWSYPTENYVFVLHLFQKVMLKQTSQHFFFPPNVSQFYSENWNRYKELIRNPLCFQDIAYAISLSYTNENSDKSIKRGQLAIPGLQHWNMFAGKDLIQAIDLVFLNALAYFSKYSKPTMRKDINRVRSMFWDEIRLKGEIKKNIPTKRGETSGFVIFKFKGNQG